MHLYRPSTGFAVVKMYLVNIYKLYTEVLCFAKAIEGLYRFKKNKLCPAKACIGLKTTICLPQRLMMAGGTLQALFAFFKCL